MEAEICGTHAHSLREGRGGSPLKAKWAISRSSFELMKCINDELTRSKHASLSAAQASGNKSHERSPMILISTHGSGLGTLFVPKVLYGISLRNVSVQIFAKTKK